MDQYGNASGSEYDLIEDGSIIEAEVVVLNLCSEVNLHHPKTALERKGFTLFELRDCAHLSKRLADAAELWIISDSSQHLTSDALDAIESFFQDGRGVYIWGTTARISLTPTSSCRGCSTWPCSATHRATKSSRC